MKKALASILAIIYLSTSMGATVHLHYCMGKLVGWGLMDQGNKNCHFCGMPKARPDPSNRCTADAKGCCHDVHKHFRNGSDQKACEPSLVFHSCTPALPDHSNIMQYAAANAPLFDRPVINGPPGLSRISIFLRDRNFRI
jgi:hypothetical protein